MGLINKAIMHILDFNAGMAVFSEKELDVKNSVETFLTKHIEKTYHDQNLKSGTFYPNSEFKKQLVAYIHNDSNFVDFSVYIADLMYSSIAKSDKLDSADILVCDLNIEGRRLIAILKCNNKVGLVHQVIHDNDGVRNDMIPHYGIMPSISQKIDEYAFVEVDSLNIKFFDKKRLIDGKEAYLIADNILECNSQISPKDTIKLVNAITCAVAENHGQSSLAAVSKAKNYIVENTEVSEYLDPVELGKEVFSSSEIMQEEYLKEVKNAGISETVKIDKAFALRKGKNHKIKTDTGIEITIPVDYFQNKDYIEFVNNPNGTISIELKNIGKVMNK